MYSYEFFANTSPIDLYFMLENGEVQEYQVPDEIWNDIGYAGYEYRNECRNENIREPGDYDLSEQDELIAQYGLHNYEFVKDQDWVSDDLEHYLGKYEG